MSVRSYWWATVLLVVAWSPTAGAQQYSGSLDHALGEAPWSGGLFLGGNYFPDDIELGNAYFDDQVPGSGFLVGARAGRMLLDLPDAPTSPALSAEVEMKLAFARTDSAGDRSASMAPILGWRAHGVAELFSDKRLHPLVLAGIGAETLISGPEHLNSPDTDLGVYAGLGGVYGVSQRGSIRADLRLEALADRDNSVTTTFEFHLGYSHRFGSRPERIGRKSLAEISPVAVEPPQDPDQAGPIQTSQASSDPDLDNILGAADKCPDEPEDKDGFSDEDGCPDADNDGDGLLDSADSCPDQGETRNGFSDQDGCPDSIPDDLAAFVGVLKGVGFTRGTSRLNRQSREPLDELAAALGQHSDVKIELAGHTDSSGKAPADQALSVRQASYIKWYLVDKGVAESRITVVGYGSTKLVGDRKSKEGRAANWRIEMRLVSETPEGGSSGSPTPVFTPKTETNDSLPTPKPSPVFKP